MSAAGVLAHQGGWDEILLVLTPVAMFAGLLWLANRRANAQLAARDEVPEDGSAAGSDEASGAGDAGGTGPDAGDDGPAGGRSSSR